MSMINAIAVDGPAGAGKSSATRELAKRLGIEYLNTGAMYRAIALRALRLGVDLSDEDALAQTARECSLEMIGGRTYLDGEDVTDAVRDPQISQLVRYPANAPKVRAILVAMQRDIGVARPIATEGRDQGTVVFPDAVCKFYLTASAEERARRRVGELRERGIEADYNEQLAQIVERDRSDSEREVGPLREPEDAIRIDSDGKTIEQVVDEMEAIARAKMNALK